MSRRGKKQTSMEQNNAKIFYYYKVPVFLVDLVVHCSVFLLLVTVLHSSNDFTAEGNITGSTILLALAYALAIIIWPLRMTDRGISVVRVIMRALVQTITTMAFFLILIVLVYKMVPRTIVFEMLGIDLVCIEVVHILFTLYLRHMRSRGRDTIPVVFVGADHNNRAIYADMKLGIGVNGYETRGMFTTLYADKIPEGLPYLGKIKDALAYLEQHKATVKEVYCSLSPGRPEELKVIKPIIHMCEANFIKFVYVPNMDGYPRHRMKLSRVGRTVVVQLHDEPLDNPVARAAKRTFDIVVSGLFVVLAFWWIYLIVGLIIKRTSPGPVFFKQQRTGYNGVSFDCLKFRSMKVCADADLKQATKDDPRKTPFGNFIRKTSIDELPQFLNVLKGDMSIIGPRPHMEHHTEIYSNLIGDYMVRHLVKPGITGWAQINGCRGETKTLEEMENRVEHDIWYIEHWSLALDIEIFFRTIWQVVSGDKQAY